MIQFRLAALAFVAFGATMLMGAEPAQACSNRGMLDDMYCDENKDLVADLPTDQRRWKNPSVLVFAYTPVEDPAVYENIFKPFTDYLGKCTSKRVVYYPVQSNSAEIEAMRSGRLHVAGFSTGPTGFAVNMAGAIPFAAKCTAEQVRGYHLAFVVKANSPYQKLRPQGQEGGPYLAVLEFGQPRAACALPRTGAGPGHGLQAADVGRP